MYSSRNYQSLPPLGIPKMLLSERGKPWFRVAAGEESRAAGGKADVGASGDRIPLWPVCPRTPTQSLGGDARPAGVWELSSSETKPEQRAAQPTLALSKPAYTYSSGNSYRDKKSFLLSENESMTSSLLKAGWPVLHWIDRITPLHQQYARYLFRHPGKKNIPG